MTPNPKNNTRARLESLIREHVGQTITSEQIAGKLGISKKEAVSLLREYLRS